jgi:rhodanese-related sulfurtransferase
MLPIEIDVTSVKSLLDNSRHQKGEPVLVLDCREPREVATAQIVGTVHIPMREIPARLGELGDDKSRRIIVHCHHGGRSLRVTQFLRQQGFDQAQNMSGGIDAWSLEIDPAVPRYQ